jgi:competence protein ComEC
MRNAKPQRAPILWVLMPWIAGMVLAPQLPAWSSNLWLFGALGFLGLAVWGYHASRKWKAGWGLWAVGVAGAAMMTAVAWQGARHPLPAWRWIDPAPPPRECEVTLRVESVTSVPDGPTGGRLAFRGRLVSDPPLGWPTGVESIDAVFFPRAIPEGWGKGALVKVRAVLYADVRSVAPRLELRRETRLEVLEPAPKVRRTLPMTVRSRMTEGFRSGFPDESRYPAYLLSIVTGEKSHLDRVDRRLFQEAGVMHFLAISGFHLAVLVGLCFGILGLMRVPKKWIAWVTVGISAVFVWITGFPVSAQRAWLMLTLFVAAGLVKRRGASLAATVFAAWLILLWDPGQLSSPGFQLSFLIVAALILHAMPLQRWIRPSPIVDAFLPADAQPWWAMLRFRLLNWACGTFVVSWTAFWTSAPLIAHYFGVVPFGAIALNTVIAPVFALLFITGLAGGVSAVAGLPFLIFVSNGLSGGLLAIILASIHALAAMPWLLFYTEPNPGLAAAGVSILLAILLLVDARQPRNRWVFAALPAISLITVLLMKAAD